MSTYAKSRLLRDVRVIIAENEQLQPLIAIGDQMALERDTLLETLVYTAIDKIHCIAPLNMLDDIINTANGLTWTNVDNGVYSAELPSDYLRVTYVKCKSWKKGVLNVVDEESETYKTFFSNFTGVKPTIYYPAAAIVKTNGEKIGNFVEVCPKDNDTDGVIVSYIPFSENAEDSEDGDGTQQTEDSEITIAGKCYWSVVYTIANLYYISTGDNNRAEAMAKEAADIIESYNKKS